MNPRSVWILGRKELRDAVRNRWVPVYAGVFSVLALAVAWVGLSAYFGAGVAGFERTGASLVHLVLFLVPLLGLVLGALGIAGERDRGTLVAILAEPVSTADVLLAKLLGLSLALAGALALGLGVAGGFIAWKAGAGHASAYAGLLGLALLLGVASLALGLLLSVLARSSAVAVGMALFLWFALVLLGDLGIMGSAAVLNLEVRELLAIALLNPLQVFKLAALFTLRGSVEAFGPVASYAAREGGAALPWILAGVLAAWTPASTLAAWLIFRRRGAI